MKMRKQKKGSSLILVVVCVFILAVLGVGLMNIAYGVRHRALKLKNEAAAMLAAEAGYEKALFWMSQQQDMLSAMQDGAEGTSGTLEFQNADCDYQIELFSFAGSRPVYTITSNGHSGTFNRTISVKVLQAVSGWDMGMCRVPTGPTTTVPVNYVNGEIIDIPIHINKYDDSPDQADIYVIGLPRFIRDVAMAESRHTDGGQDKYVSMINCFEGGIYFDQPESRVSDEASMQTKITRFKNSTDAAYRFTPTASAGISPSYPAVQLEFFVDPNDGEGKVRITNNCTIQGDNPNTYDYKIVPGSNGDSYHQYNIYKYHYKPDDESSVVVPVTDTYVTQSIGGMESEPGGQIYVKGSVVIGGSASAQVVKGKLTIVADRLDDGTGGHIWIADSLVVDSDHDANGLPVSDNPNIVGLLAQGVIKVVNPTDGPTSAPAGLIYQPIGIKKNPSDANNVRYLPDPVVIESALTVGGGGFGAEDLASGPSGRREYFGVTDDLVVRGTITEAVRGAVGLTNSDGFVKKYYLDSRLLEGVLPGDIWLRGKYIPAPAGWHDYRPSE